MIRSLTLAVAIMAALAFQAHGFESSGTQRFIKFGSLIQVNINHPDNFNLIIGVFLPNPDNSESMGDWLGNGRVHFVIGFELQNKHERREPYPCTYDKRTWLGSCYEVTVKKAGTSKVLVLYGNETLYVLKENKVQKTIVIIRQKSENGYEEHVHEFKINNWAPVQSASLK